MSLQLTVLILLISAHFLPAQRGYNAEPGSRSLSLGGIRATLDQQDAILNNPANLSDIDQTHIILTGHQRFINSDLNGAALGATRPLGENMVMGMFLNRFGILEFSEHKLSLFASRKLSSRFSVAVNLDYNFITTSGHGYYDTFSFTLSGAGQLSHGLEFGVIIMSPEKLEYKENSELRSAIIFGLKKEISEYLVGYIEISKLIDQAPSVLAGFEYAPSPVWCLRLGASTNPGLISFGLGYRWSQSLRIDIGAGYHILLGITPGVSLKNYI